jgi:hypothetical protein
MFNHGRTLLANLDSTVIVPGSDYPSLEPVDPNFHSLKLKYPFSELYKIFFGTNPDIFYILYRTEQLMRILHNTEYSSFLTNLDNRITYDFSRKNLFDLNSTRIELINNGSAYTEDTQIQIAGDFVANDTIGRSEYKWELKTYYKTFNYLGDSIDIPYYDIHEFRSDESFNEIVPNLNRVGTTVESVTSVDPDTGKIFLPSGFVTIPGPATNESFFEPTPGGGGFDFKFIVAPGLNFIHNLIVIEPDVITSIFDIYDLEGVYPGDSKWLITVRCRPNLDLSYILRAVQKYETAILTAAAGLGEPYQTFLNLFQNHYALPYRLTGLILLYIYMVDRQRNGS